MFQNNQEKTEFIKYSFQTHQELLQNIHPLYIKQRWFCRKI